MHARGAAAGRTEPGERVPVKDEPSFEGWPLTEALDYRPPTSKHASNRREAGRR